MATSTEPNLASTYTHFTPELQQRFLDLVADAHSLSGAAKLLNIHRDTVYDLRQRDPNFAAAVDKAIKQRGDFWEQCLRNLGDREKPDTLAVIVGLKKEGRFVEPQYAAKLNVNVNVKVSPLDEYTPEQLRALIAKIDAQLVEHSQVVDVKALPAGEPDATEG